MIDWLKTSFQYSIFNIRYSISCIWLTINHWTKSSSSSISGEWSISERPWRGWRDFICPLGRCLPASSWPHLTVPYHTIHPDSRTLSSSPRVGCCPRRPRNGTSVAGHSSLLASPLLTTPLHSALPCPVLPCRTVTCSSRPFTAQRQTRHTPHSTLQKENGD